MPSYPQNQFNPASPPGDPQNPWGSNGNTPVASLPDYLVEWEPPSSQYLLGEEVALKWTITRLDGAEVPIPLSATVLVIEDNNVQATLFPLADSSIPEFTVTLGVAYQFPAAGNYRAFLLADIDGTQIRGQSELIVVEEVVAPQPWTYDPSTIRGRVRLWSRDTDVESQFFADRDIDAMLSEAGYTGLGTDTWSNDFQQNVLLAASYTVLLRAGDASYLAVIEKIAIFSDNTVVTFKSIGEYSQYLLKNALSNAFPSSYGPRPDTYDWGKQAPWTNPLDSNGLTPSPSQGLKDW